MTTKDELKKNGVIIITETDFEDLSCKKCDSTNLIFEKKIDVACNCKFAIKKTEPYLLLSCAKCGQQHAGKY